MAYSKSLVWFRRDLRDFDHAALYHALKTSKQVYCVFVFDTLILDKLENKQDRRVEFIWESIRELKIALQSRGGDLIVKHGKTIDIVAKLAIELDVKAVFTNREYEPSELQRDEKVAQQVLKSDIEFHD
ncbi:MAG TPA: deoxyribodipyrimidine photo-lyase, partial [Methylotenera sp.]|nr:deoxyribodipyrimidine photo-lyase [Methylotenera sp.]